MKKRVITSVLGIGIAVALAYAGFFFFRNFKGVLPAIQKPAVDLSEYTGGLPLTLPPGFSISIFAKQLDGPRVMTMDSRGTLLVSLTKAGKIVALSDADRDGAADATVVLADNLNGPHGMFLKCVSADCRLFVAEEDSVSVFAYDADRLRLSDKKKLLTLPEGGNHTTRTIIPYDDKGKERMLISVGSSCNVCYEKDDQRAKILIADLDGTNVEEFARGLRNSVFMTQHPVTGDVWATEMGRDFLGDDLPPDEINIIRKGRNYGWPICYGKNVHDADFDKNTYIRNPCMEPFEAESHIDIPAHSAPLGLAFANESWGKEHRGDLFVAYHGSWNRSVPTGYKVVRMKFDENGGYTETEDLITGWLTDKGVSGRPADILVRSGTMYISDDKASVIYRVMYNNKTNQ